MIARLKRPDVQVLQLAGHTRAGEAPLSGVSIGVFWRVVDEEAPTAADHDADRDRRQTGRLLHEVSNHEL